MPFVRIDLIRGKTPECRKALGDIVYKALLDVIRIPEDDKFQVITEHAPEEINVTHSYLGNRYSSDVSKWRRKTGPSAAASRST